MCDKDRDKSHDPLCYHQALDVCAHLLLADLRELEGLVGETGLDGTLRLDNGGEVGGFADGELGHGTNKTGHFVGCGLSGKKRRGGGCV